MPNKFSFSLHFTKIYKCFMLTFSIKCFNSTYISNMSVGIKPRVLIIDNGSYECRVGWSDASKPELRFRNVLTKPRKDRKKEKDTPDNPSISVIQVGNDITNIEAVRAQLKSPFDRNVITNWNHQEQILDYIFSNVGFENQSIVANPIVLTEALANPNSCRQQMNELLFECYGVPAVSYGIDALFSWQHYEQQKKYGIKQDALIISFGFSTTHVIPVLDGKMQMQNVRRLNVGGYHIITFLFRLMQMKYPVHINAITISRIESLVHQNCFIATDYEVELSKWSPLDYYEKHVMKIQLPYNAVAVANSMLTVEQKQEKRRELALRLIELKNKRDRDKHLEEEQQLETLKGIRQLYEQNKLQKFERALQQEKMNNLEELEKIIVTLQQSIKRFEDRANQPKPKPQQDKIAKPPANVPQEEWLEGLRTKREEILKRKQARQTQRQEQAKRHTHAAQERMRIISSLARNEKRRKGNEVDDNFGMNDDDWDVYKRINRYNDDSDSDSDNEKLLECEKILNHYDTNFDDGGTSQAITEAQAAEDYQLHFGVEAIRAPEILFQPSMIGCPEAGLAELIDYVLKLFPSDQQQRLVDHVVLTGGCAQFRGLKERLNKELLAMRPFQTSFAIYLTSSPLLGAWLGACEFARSDECANSFTTKSEYQEYGGEYFKEHRASNMYCPTPKEE